MLQYVSLKFTFCRYSKCMYNDRYKRRRSIIPFLNFKFKPYENLNVSKNNKHCSNLIL